VQAGAAVVFFAYIGFDAVSTVAEEVRNPARDLPIGIIGSLLICTAPACSRKSTNCSSSRASFVSSKPSRRRIRGGVAPYPRTHAGRATGHHCRPGSSESF